MKEEERKQKFVKLLYSLLEESGGVKGKLAKKLDIKPSTLTRWLQGKVDPANIDLTIFANLAKFVSLSNAELVRVLGIDQNSKDLVLHRFTKLIQELLSSQSQKELSEKLGVTSATISNWISSQTNIDPRRMDIGTLTALANEKGWTVDELLLYLGLTKENTSGKDWLSEFQTKSVQLPLSTQVKLLTWFLEEFISRVRQWELEKEFSQEKLEKAVLSDLAVSVLLEKADLASASNYLQNLYTHTNINPENINVTTIDKLLSSQANLDTLIFDISSHDSPSIQLIEEIEFEGNIIVFAPADLPQTVIANISNQVTEVLVKPIDWSSLRNKEYFR